jgi:hypothetical protein
MDEGAWALLFPYLVIGRLDSKLVRGGHRISGGVVGISRLTSVSLCLLSSGHNLQLMWSGESIVNPFLLLTRMHSDYNAVLRGAAWVSLAELHVQCT